MAELLYEEMALLALSLLEFLKASMHPSAEDEPLDASGEHYPR